MVERPSFASTWIEISGTIQPDRCVTEEALRSIPKTVEEGGLALGMPRRRVILRVLLRSAMPMVMTGLFLSIARVAGEAAPLLFTAFGSNDWPGSPTKPVESLPELLYDYAR